MSKYRFFPIGLVLWALVSACGNNEEELIFDKTADERVAEATADLRQKLTAPTNGWIMRYQPVPESGTYNVLLNFDADGGVRIRTDFGVNNNEFYDQMNTYRVDNSLGLELIFESYSFFSYLFEQNGATFEAEYEFVYVNETPNGELVLTSKTDLSFTSSTIVVLEPAPSNAEQLLGRQINSNLETLSATLGVVSPVYRLNYANRDLSLYLSLNTFLRQINFTYATPLSGANAQAVNFSTGYRVEDNTIILDDPLSDTYFGVNVTIPAINLRELADAGTIDACNEAVAIRQYQGTIAESGEPVGLFPLLSEPGGGRLQNLSEIFVANVGGIYDNGVSVGQQVFDATGGAVNFVIYHIQNEQRTFYAMGYLLQLSEGGFSIPVKEFTPGYEGNRVTFDFAPTYSFANGDTTVTLNQVALDTYLNNLTEGGQTRLIQTGQTRYEMFNPCTGWSVLLQQLE